MIRIPLHIRMIRSIATGQYNTRTIFYKPYDLARARITHDAMEFINNALY